MIIGLSLKNVFRNKRRTTITITIIIVGVSMLLLVLSFVEYIKWGLRESTIHSQTGHFQLMTRNHAIREEEKLMADGIPNWEELVDQVESIDEVMVAAPRIGFTGLISTNEKSAMVLASAVDPAKEIPLGSKFINPKSYQSLQNKPEGIVLGHALAKSLNVQVEDEVTVMATTTEGALNAIDLVVVDTMKLSSKELSQRFALITIPSAMALLDTKKVEYISLGLYSTEMMMEAYKKLQKIISSDFTTKRWDEVAPYFRQVMNFFYQFIYFLIPVLMIIVWFSTMNTIMMSVLERTSEIASLRAMGTSKGFLFKMLFLEGVWIGLIGITLGIVVEIGLSNLINHMNIMMPPPPGENFGYALMIRNAWPNFIFVGVLTNIIVALSTLLPALRIFRLNIVRALRQS